MTSALNKTIESTTAALLVANGQAHNSVLKRLATRAMGMTGADVERVVREARLKARREKRAVSIADLEISLRLSRPPQSPELLRLHAVHEEGHALVHHVLQIGPILGVTIDSSSGAFGNLGFRADRAHSLSMADDTIAMLMAGRAAEIIVFGKPGAGAGGTNDCDLARATNLAVSIERTWGLGEDLPLLYRPSKDNTVVLDHDRGLAIRIHARLEQAQERAGEIISRHRATLDALAAALVEAQALEGADVVRILEEAGAGPEHR
ncbi:ATP-dependent Zn protease [Rhizobium sp. PAMB 3174]